MAATSGTLATAGTPGMSTAVKTTAEAGTTATSAAWTPAMSSAGTLATAGTQRKPTAAITSSTAEAAGLLLTLATSGM